MARSTPLVQHGVLQLAGATRAPVTVGSAAWYAWLDGARSFVFVQGAARFTAHKERFQRGGWYWRAYRRHGGKLRRVYLGKTEALTPQHLAQALARMCGHVKKLAPSDAAAEQLQTRRSAAASAARKESALQQPGAAIRHAIDGRDAEAAAGLIEAQAVEWFGRGEAAQVGAWIEALPRLLLSKRPRLLLVYVRSRLLAGAWEGIEGLLRAPDSCDGVEADVLRALSALLGGHIDESAHLAQRAAAMIEPSDVLLYTMNAMTLASAAWVRGETQSALRQVSGARRAGMAQFTDIALVALSHEALFLMRSGRLHAAQARYSRVLDTVDNSPHRLLPATGMAALGLGRLLYERNLLSEAAEQMQRAHEYGRRRENTGIVIGSLAGLARVLQAQGRWSEASALLDEAELLLHGVPEQLAVIVASGRAWLALAQGDATAAVACLEQHDTYNTGYLAAQAESAQLALAHARLLQQRPGDALALLAPLRRAAEQAQRRGSLVGLLAAEALAHQAAGRDQAAVAALQEVLPHARDEGYIRSFVDAGPALVEPLRRAQPRSSADAYVATLLSAFAAGGIAPAPLRATVEPLTRRELDVLRLVAIGASNDEVAAQLSFSASNVKKRLRSVFHKLGVRRRTQAVARARELRIL